ncbi:transglutaminase-like domain-containing protein [Clostridiaceae bacterium 35-E11]
MQKRSNRWILFTTMFFLLFNVGQVSQAQQIEFVQKNNVSLTQLPSNTVEGVVELTGTTDQNKIKILLKKDNIQKWFDVQLDDGRFHEALWLTDGKGAYTISIMVHEKDRNYRYGPSINIINIQEVNKYLVPTKHVESTNEVVVSLSKAITKNQKTDRRKAKSIYDWVVNNIRYDFDKFNEHQNKNYDHLYGALNTLKTKKGVCYDYASLTAALGRAAGLQVKMIKGEGITNVYKGLHAWNEIYIADEKKWISVDTTFGSTSNKNFFDSSGFDKTHIQQGEY